MTETQDAIEILDDLFGDTPGYREAVAKEVTNSHVARLIYKARNEAGLSQQGLADKIGSRQSVISRLEKADYSGHSLSILQKIVSALGLKLVIEIVKPDEVAVISHAAVWKSEPAPINDNYSKKKVFEDIYGSDATLAGPCKPHKPTGYRLAV